MRIGRFCIDWKVLAGLAAVAVGLLLFQPRLLTAALPVLLIAACPLSMLLMMWGMRSMSDRLSGPRTGGTAESARADRPPAQPAEHFAISPAGD